MRRTTELRHAVSRLTAALLVAMLAAPVERSSAAEMIEDTPGEKPLNSVLVSKRKSRADSAARTALEPISQVSDKEPELAEPEDAEPAPPLKRASRSRPADTRLARRTTVARVSRADDGEPRPAQFRGVRPGSTTIDELLNAWGEPERTAAADTGRRGDEVLTFDAPPFRGVDVLVQRDKVRAIRVSLSERSTLDELTDRLGLAGVDPVEVTDPDDGALLGVAFPEKGLTLLTPDTSTPDEGDIDQLVLQPLDSKAFAARAESRPDDACSKKLDDLRQALAIDPDNAHALWLEAGVRRSVGQSDPALKAAAAAARLDGGNAAYRLRWAECLGDMALYDRAVLQTRRVLDDDSAPEVVRAQALHAMGRLASLGDEAIASKAIGFHTAAIEAADRLATSPDDRERRAAKQLLVDAHLAVAREIARRDFGNKLEVVGEWIGRASGLAEEWIESDNGGVELRLRVAREALGALASLRPPKDPAPWIREAEEAAEGLLDEKTDELFRARVEWELGEAYQHAVRIEHTRGDLSRALRHGSDAIERLSRSAEPRVSSPNAALTVGRLYFYLGAANAIHKQDHEEAVNWYEKARPIFAADRPESEFVVPRREGEAMVSMAVSYWEQGQKHLAVDLTNRGARLMRRSVAAGVTKERSLGVPYGNLAGMHRSMGNGEESTRFRRLAANARGEAAPATEPTTRATAVARRPNPSPSENRRAESGGGESKSRGVLARRPSYRQTRLK